MSLARLRALVAENKLRQELDCGKIPRKKAHILLVPAKTDVVFVDAELNTPPGRVDLIVVADQARPDGNDRRIAYIWELKAPQCYIFELDGPGRARPSRDLYAAENQLIHYCATLAGDQLWRQRWRILSPEHVMPGGIVIGRRSTFVRAAVRYQARDRPLANQALDLRQQYLYRSYNIEVMTWDRVVELIPLLAHSYQSRKK